jgi:hypothetical protein
MNKSYGVAFRLGTLLMAGGSLTGCLTQALGSAISAGVEASATPESVGVSTASWRGKSCKDLEFSHEYMAEDQRKSAASGDSFSAKISGWQMDAINQVRTEQGCIAGATGVKVAANGQVTAYGYCVAADQNHQYVTPVFVYGDYYADSGAAESTAFSAMLKSTYGFTDGGSCVMEDSSTKAQAAIERFASLTNLQFRDTVRVAWTPPPMVKAAKANVAVTSATVSGKTTTPIAARNFDAPALGLSLETPSPELVKALGLRDNSGAWVVSVTPGSPAAKAGIKPMDVIQHLSGQIVTAPNDVQIIAGKLRAGYRAPLGVWRERSNQELTLTIPARAAATLVVAKTQPLADVPVVAAKQTTPLVQATDIDAKPYCHAYIYVVKKPGGWQSPIFKTPTGNQTPAEMMDSLSAFVAKVRQEQPEQWRPFTFPANQCATNVGYCYANGETSLFKADQMAGQFCFASLAEAETHLATFNSVTPVYERVDFKP